MNKKETTPQINIDSLGDEVISTSDISVLYRHDLLLRKIKADCFLQLARNKGSQIEEEPIKATLDMVMGIHDICLKRQDELIQKENANNKFNSRFRFLAKRMLPKDDYERIQNEAEKRL